MASIAWMDGLMYLSELHVDLKRGHVYVYNLYICMLMGGAVLNQNNSRLEIFNFQCIYLIV